MACKNIFKPLHQVKWPGFTDKGTLVLPVEMNRSLLTTEIQHFVKGPFLAKHEHHVTLIGKKLGNTVMRKIQQHPGMQKQLVESFEAIDWSFKLCGPIHLLSRMKPSEPEGSRKGISQKSLVILIEMPGTGQFYDALKSLNIMHREVPVPPPHITLYTQNCPYGIGVPSAQTLKRFTEKIFPKKFLFD